MSSCRPWDINTSLVQKCQGESSAGAKRERADMQTEEPAEDEDKDLHNLVIFTMT